MFACKHKLTFDACLEDCVCLMINLSGPLMFVWKIVYV